MYTSCNIDSCTEIDSCKARGINGGRKGAVVDEHGWDGTEMEAEKSCVGTGRTPRVEEERDVDTGTSAVEASFASGKVCRSGSRGVSKACCLCVGGGQGKGRRRRS